MKKIIFLLLLNLFSIASFSQKKPRFSVEVNYGLQANFFVGTYDENNGPVTARFLKKNVIGSMAAIDAKYRIGKRSALGIGYGKSVNKRTVNYDGNNIYILDFTIRHINEFYQLFYERNFIDKKNKLSSDIGLFYVRPYQQEIDVYNNFIDIEERDYKTSNLEEGGAFLGIHYSRKINPNFYLGIRSRVYFLLSTSMFETLTLTPTLTYTF